jgi:hypothetical protein
MFSVLIGWTESEWANVFYTDWLDRVWVGQCFLYWLARRSLNGRMFSVLIGGTESEWTNVFCTDWLDRVWMDQCFLYWLAGRSLSGPMFSVLIGWTESEWTNVFCTDWRDIVWVDTCFLYRCVEVHTLFWQTCFLAELLKKRRSNASSLDLYKKILCRDACRNVCMFFSVPGLTLYFVLSLYIPHWYSEQHLSQIRPWPKRCMHSCPFCFATKVVVAVERECVIYSSVLNSIACLKMYE